VPWWQNKTTMENQEKEQLKPDLMADNSDQELTNNIDGTQSVPESDMMSDDGTDNLEIANLKDLESAYDPKRKMQISEVDLPNDVPNDETPPLIDMPKNYERMKKKDIPNDSSEKK
jgi:hypothetical protein